MKTAHEVLEVNREELQAVLEQARKEPLDEAGYEKLQALLRAFSYVADLIGEKDTTISQLRALLMKPSTEKTNKVLEQAGLKPGSKSHLPDSGGKAKPGHGRNGAEAYRGAEQIHIPHASLKPGDCCPECLTRSTRRSYRLCASGWWAKRRFRLRSTNWRVCAVTCAERFLRRKRRRAWARTSTTRVPQR